MNKVLELKNYILYHFVILGHDGSVIPTFSPVIGQIKKNENFLYEIN